MVPSQFEGAESKYDECHTRNLEHFTQNTKIQDGRQIMKTFILRTFIMLLDVLGQIEGADSKTKDCQMRTRCESHYTTYYYVVF